jgi:hypothetical protein
LKSLLSRKSARHSSLLTAGNPPSIRAAITSPSETGTNQSRIRMIHMMHLPSTLCVHQDPVTARHVPIGKLRKLLAKIGAPLFLCHTFGTVQATPRIFIDSFQSAVIALAYHGK